MVQGKKGWENDPVLDTKSWYDLVMLRAASLSWATRVCRLDIMCYNSSQNSSCYQLTISNMQLLDFLSPPLCWVSPPGTSHSGGSPSCGTSKSVPSGHVCTLSVRDPPPGCSVLSHLAHSPASGQEPQPLALEFLRSITLQGHPLSAIGEPLESLSLVLRRQETLSLPLPMRGVWRNITT